MNNKLLGTIIFAAGAAIGSIATWVVVKKKYEQIAQGEINSVKEEYDRLIKMRRKEMEAVRKVINANQSKSDDDDSEDTEAEDETEAPKYEQIKIEYNNIAKSYRSSEDNDEDDEYDEENDEEGDEGDEDEAPYINGPYVISPDVFGDEPSYSAQPLDYYSDDILSDGWGVILDIDKTIGEEALDHFGEYADDVVYVRNERTEIDYEVTRDPRTYKEAMDANPDPYYCQ